MEVECSIEKITERTAIGITFIDGVSQSNAGAVAFNDFLIVLDPSPEDYTAEIFRQKIEKHFQLPTKYLFISHYHGDHVRGAIAFKDVVKFGSQKLLPMMQRTLETSWKDIREKIVFPNILFNDRLTLSDEDLHIEFHWVGGHTECSAYAYFLNEKVLFAGDLVFAERFPWAGDPTCNPDLWIAAFEEFLKLDFKYLLPGHGPMVGREEINKQLKQMVDLRKLIIDAVKDNQNVETIQPKTIYNSPYEYTIPRTIQHFYNFYKNRN